MNNMVDLDSIFNCFSLNAKVLKISFNYRSILKIPQ